MKWANISKWIDRLIDLVGSAMVLITITCTAINIFSRWIMGRSMGQLDEISLMAFVWTIYVGVGLLYNCGEHISMDFVLKRLPHAPKLILTFVNLVIELAVSVLVTGLAIKLMSRSFIRTTNVTHVPYAFLQASIAVGFGLLALSLFAKALRMILAVARKQDPLEKEPGEGDEA